MAWQLSSGTAAVRILASCASVARQTVQHRHGSGQTAWPILSKVAGLTSQAAAFALQVSSLASDKEEAERVARELGSKDAKLMEDKQVRG